MIFLLLAPGGLELHQICANLFINKINYFYVLIEIIDDVHTTGIYHCP